MKEVIKMTMTKEMVMAIINEVEEDAFINIFSNGDVHVTMNDCEENEEYDMDRAERVEEEIAKRATARKGNYVVREYFFEGFKVVWTECSWDD